MNRSISFIILSVFVSFSAASMAMGKEQAITEQQEHYCAGFHSFAIPEGFSPGNVRASLGIGEATIIRDYQGSPTDYVSADPEQGQIARQKSINAWNVIIAQRTSNKGQVRHGSYTLNTIYRLDGDAIVFQDFFNEQALQDGLDSPLLTFVPNNTVVERLSPQTIKRGFCIEDFVFIQRQRRPGERISFFVSRAPSTSERRPIVAIDFEYGRFVPNDLPSENYSRAPSFAREAFSRLGGAFDIERVNLDGQQGELLLSKNRDESEFQGEIVFPGVPGNDRQPAIVIAYNNPASFEEMQAVLRFVLNGISFNRQG